MKTVRRKCTALVLAVLLALVLAGCGVQISSIGLPDTEILEPGESLQLEPVWGTDAAVSTAEAAQAAEKLALTWASSDEGVVTVDENGLVTAVAPGEASVTVTCARPELTAATNIRVVLLPDGVTAPETMTLALNGTASQALGARMTPKSAAGAQLTYTSSDETVATVDADGTVTAVGTGVCRITASLAAEPGLEARMPQDAQAVTEVTVGKAVERITLDASSATLTVGGSRTLKAATAPEDATDTALTWTSSDESVATVDANGTVTAVAAGRADITAAGAGGTVTAVCKLTVKNITCSYCGQTGHTSSSCPVQAADRAAQQQAADRAAQQQAAAQAAAQQQAAEQAAQQQAAQQAAQQQQQQQQASGGSSGGSPVPGDWDAGFGLSSGIDWTQDSSCGSLNGEADCFD